MKENLAIWAAYTFSFLLLLSAIDRFLQRDKGAEKRAALLHSSTAGIVYGLICRERRQVCGCRVRPRKSSRVNRKQWGQWMWQRRGGVEVNPASSIMHTHVHTHTHTLRKVNTTIELKWNWNSQILEGESKMIHQYKAQCSVFSKKLI